MSRGSNFHQLKPIQELKKPRARERLLGRFLGSELGFREGWETVETESYHIVVSLNGGTPNLHPKMIIFSRKKPWLLGATIFGNIHMGSHNLFLSVVQGFVFFNVFVEYPTGDVLLVLSN